MLPGGMLRDRFGPRWTTAVAGVFSALGIFSVTLGPSYGLVLTLWCIGSFFTGFIYNNAVTTGIKWFRDRRGAMTGVIAGAFSWGSIPFIFWIRGISPSSPKSTFFTVIYVMTGLIAVVAIVAAQFMRDPPTNWAPAGWVPTRKGHTRPNDHEYTLIQAMTTWQMWVMIISFILISGAGLAGVSRVTDYAGSFGFAAAAGTAAAAGISVGNGLGKLALGWVSERFGAENTMIVSYSLCGLLLFASVAAGNAGLEGLFIATAILSIFFWASLFSLFPILIGAYYGNASAGGNYGILYAIAKGSGGVYGGIVTTLLISHHGFSFGMEAAAALAIIAGLLIVPLRFYPVRGRGKASTTPTPAEALGVVAGRPQATLLAEDKTPKPPARAL
jgi:OFA family oxalate/formate antiporter-like MFS transporter